MTTPRTYSVPITLSVRITLHPSPGSKVYEILTHDVRCAQCGKRIERLEVEEDPGRDRQIVRAFCHGATERYELAGDVTLHDFAGEAFVLGPRRLGP